MGKNPVKPLQRAPLEGRVGYTWPILLSIKGGIVRITRSLSAIIVTLFMAALPVAAPAQLSVGVGFSVGAPPPPLPVYSQPVAPYPNYQWTPGYWGWGPAGYYWVPGTWVAPPSVGVYWTPGYWGAGYNGGVRVEYRLLGPERRVLRWHQLRFRLLRCRIRRRLLGRQRLQVQRSGNERQPQRRAKRLRQQDRDQ